MASPPAAELGNLFERFLKAHFRLAFLLRDIEVWSMSLSRDDEPLQALARRLDQAARDDYHAPATAETVQTVARGEHPFIPPPSEWAPGTRLVPLELKEIVGARKALDSVLGARSRYREMVAEMALTAVVAAFEVYLLDSLRVVLVNRPEMIKRSKKTVAYADVVEAPSKEALIAQLADREIRGLGYETVPAQAQVIQNRFGVDLADTDGVTIESIAETFARRNLLLHNDGTVNETYLATSGVTEVAIGDRLQTSVAYWDEKSGELAKVAAHVSRALSARFFPDS